jgi:probable phosphomutase (TIGR03848 family)
MTRPTQILLIRHAHSTANLKGILAGRDNKVGLTDRGLEEAKQLSTYLHSLYLDKFVVNRVVTSPLLRARETIAPFLSMHKGIELIRDSGIVEMDYGSWSGKKLAILAKRPLWREIQRRPSTVRFPNGESFLEMASRSSEAVTNLSLPGKTTIFVSHGDVIKSIVAGFLGLHLDQFQRIAIEPASITKISLHEGSPVINFINSTSHLNKNPSLHVDSTLGGGAGAISKPSTKGSRRR